MRFLNCFLFLMIGSMIPFKIMASVWQWSVPVTSVVSGETNAHPRAFLWIPENCKQVRAVIVGQHNMSEENIFEHPRFRNAMEELGIAQIWVTPAIDMVFDFDNGAGEQFEGMMKANMNGGRIGFNLHSIFSKSFQSPPFHSFAMQVVAILMCPISWSITCRFS